MDDIDRAYNSPELMRGLVDCVMEESDEMTCKCQDDADLESNCKAPLDINQIADTEQLLSHLMVGIY